MNIYIIVNTFLLPYTICEETCGGLIKPEAPFNCRGTALDDTYRFFTYLDITYLNAGNGNLNLPDHSNFRFKKWSRTIYIHKTTYGGGGGNSGTI